jgi:hypothetical protein
MRTHLRPLFEAQSHWFLVQPAKHRLDSVLALARGGGVIDQGDTLAVFT